MHFLTAEDIIKINQEVLGVSTLRDRPMLEAAVARPRQSLFGIDAYPTLAEKAGALMHSLILNHPFLDGNKRTATIAVRIFLMGNGKMLHWDRVEALQFIVEIAQGRHNAAEIAQWLETNSFPEK